MALKIHYKQVRDLEKVAYFLRNAEQPIADAFEGDEDFLHQLARAVAVINHLADLLTGGEFTVNS